MVIEIEDLTPEQEEGLAIRAQLDDVEFVSAHDFLRRYVSRLVGEAVHHYEWSRKQKIVEALDKADTETREAVEEQLKFRRTR